MDPADRLRLPAGPSWSVGLEDARIIERWKQGHERLNPQLANDKPAGRLETPQLFVMSNLFGGGFHETPRSQITSQTNNWGVLEMGGVKCGS